MPDQPAITAERVHVSITTIVSAACALLVFGYQALAGDIDETTKNVQKNAEAIAVLVEHDKTQAEDIIEIKDDVDETAKLVRVNQRTLDRIAIKLEVEPVSDDE